jgi:hypothetical protein
MIIATPLPATALSGADADRNFPRQNNSAYD